MTPLPLSGLGLAAGGGPLEMLLTLSPPYTLVDGDGAGDSGSV